MEIDKIKERAIKQLKAIISEIENYSIPIKIEIINAIKIELHKHSPLATEPVDCVLWINRDVVIANDYNPNAVAPPEMRLLEHSITMDGYTQPIVTWKHDGIFEVVDGFHRYRVGNECAKVSERIKGYLPITAINADREDRGDRIAATIRHNRARGKHLIEGMSEIIIELKRRNWSDRKIGKELGMDPDEVLRLAQITGLAEMFADREFSQAWKADEEMAINESDTLEILEENIDIDLIKTEQLISDAKWEIRTDNKSILIHAHGRVFAQIKKLPERNNWNWYAYTVPIQTGIANTPEKAKEEAENAFRD